ncbi:MAG TPA: non-homologous end-joining DNA ligase [Chthonomonadaceae bacterium]|nr:non-homologous end-joining DNA ligase [Chthonomonadaceae bacterium]
MRTVTIGPHRIELTHTDRVLFPEAGITKGDLIAYYRDMADTMLPHLQGRPLTLHRFPGGLAKGGFIQKEAPDYYPDWIRRVSVAKEQGRLTQAVCDNAATLVYLANQDCITLHVWLSRVDHLDFPDRMAFDLDPPDTDFALARSAARDLRDLLAELGLTAYLMTTGSRGLHVLVALAPKTDFDTVRHFAHQVAEALVRRDPDRRTTEPRKEQRGGRLYVDILRNAYAQTTVAPYSVRARASAPVATPLGWSELDDPELTSDRYTLRTIPERLAQRGDPWERMEAADSLEAPRRRLQALLSGGKDTS